MGLIGRTGFAARIERLRYVWTWRARYWWLDTDSGRRAHVVAYCMALLVVILDLIQMAVAARAPQPAVGEPVKAWIWWVVYIIVALVAAAVAYAMRPKPESAKPTEEKGPTTEDGQAVVRYWGTHWVDDTFQLAWKVVGRDPIKGKGGK